MAPKTTRKGSRKTTKTAKRAARRAPAVPKPQTLTPYLAVNDAAKAVAWYKEVFGGKVVTTQPGAGGKLMHAHLTIGSSQLYLSDIFPGSDMQDPARVGTSVNLHYHAPNAGHVWERAVAKGAKVTMPFEDTFWGDRYGRIVDPFGHSWAISRKSPLSKKELDALRAKAMAQMGGAP